ncbi:hypothetical protein ACN28C_04580 [Plantactinospora sp. WMMC1484]|uniref:hypothetical protein n=1 Tax=Plantactinospora sp. WMMC1484 TaxID=3404122 RepID=UPI003BF548B6
MVLSAEPEPVAVLGIDEVRRGKPHWVWDDRAGSWTVTADRRQSAVAVVARRIGGRLQMSGILTDRARSPEQRPPVRMTAPPPNSTPATRHAPPEVSD